VARPRALAARRSLARHFTVQRTIQENCGKGGSRNGSGPVSQKCHRLYSCPENIESDTARYESWRNDARARLEELSRPGIGHNNPPGSFSVFPNLSGRRAKISGRDDPETRRGLYRENESADVLYAARHSVEQSPTVTGIKTLTLLSMARSSIIQRPEQTAREISEVSSRKRSRKIKRRILL
jgi:hypothetical protein